jgi:solute carrier family 25 oxoglutarate transporter 11
MKFVTGGLSGMGATLFVQPLDLVKTRMQLSGEGQGKGQYKTSVHAVVSIVRNEGVRAVYRGLGAGLLRQATYTTTRLGVFQWLSDLTSRHGKQSSFSIKLLTGMTAGGIGALVGTPAEVALIRLMADGRLPPAQRRNYKGAINALYRIAREEGVFTLWRGWKPTVMRAMILNAAQLGVYAQAKQMLLNTGWFKDNMITHFIASFISGFFSTLVSIPVDITKTRLQNMKVIDGKPQYKGTIDCLVKTVKVEGVFSLWKGFTPYFLRLGPHTILTFIFLEKLNKLLRMIY